MSADLTPNERYPEEYGEGFHDRLAEFWPEPKEQLHAGGWTYTRSFLSRLNIAAGQSVLDVCCGEGATACWLAQSQNVRVTGVDIVRSAIEAARERAARLEVSDKCTFIHADIADLPVTSSTYDLIYGQDPDGFARDDRARSFRECARVLRPGRLFGIHHWIPGPGATPDIVQSFDRANHDAGYPSHINVHADAYVEAMTDAGLREIEVEDISEMYQAHLKAITSRMLAAGKTPDPWASIWIKLAARHPFGVALFARKP